MEGFTIIDGIAAILIILSAFLAYARGFAREALAIGGWVAAIAIGYLFADEVRPFLVSVPVLSDFLGDQCELALLASFAVVMVAGLIIMSIFTPFFSGLVRNSVLAGMDQGLGFLFGVVRGALLVVVALMVYEFTVTGDSVPVIEDSRTAAIFDTLRAEISERLPENIPGWLQERFNTFVVVCEEV